MHSRQHIPYLVLKLITFFGNKYSRVRLMRFFLMRPLVTWLCIDVSPVSPPQFPSSQIDTKPFCIVIRKYIRRKCEFRRALLLRCGLVYKANHWFWFLIRITEWKSQRAAWNRKYGGIFGTSVADHSLRIFTAAFAARVFKPEDRRRWHSNPASTQQLVVVNLTFEWNHPVPV